MHDLLYSVTVIFSKFQFEKLKQYIATHARPLDKALYKFEFENGSPQTVIKNLKTYQNMDGGFGQALEPDFRTNKSSVLATTVAMQYLNELKLSKPNEMIRQAISYLINERQQFPEEFPLKYYWYPTPIEPDQSLHAPWWSLEKLEPPNLEEWPNPSAEVIGYLLQYSQLIMPSFQNELIKDLRIYLKIVPKITKSIYYNFLCFKRLLPHVPIEVEEDLFITLDRSFGDIELLKQTKLNEIKIQKLVTEKTSFLFQKFPEKIIALIKNEVDHLGSDGGSHPNWKWGENALWKQVEKEWTGKCTYDLLVTLKYCDLLH